MNLWLCGLLLASLCGCSPSSSDISGKVSFAGQDVAEGSIRFEPLDRQSASFGGMITNGQYQITVPASVLRPTTYLVRIDALRKTGRKIPAGPPEPEGTMVDETLAYIPEIYNTASILKRELAADGIQIIDFELVPGKN